MKWKDELFNAGLILTTFAAIILMVGVLVGCKPRDMPPGTVLPGTACTKYGAHAKTPAGVDMACRKGPGEPDLLWRY